jgi:DNA-binding NtrC family response regulator
MDGFQLAHWVREKFPKIQVFLTSGYTGKAEPSADLAAEYPFFAKPYNLDNVVAQIRDALKHAPS